MRDYSANFGRARPAGGTAGSAAYSGPVHKVAIVVCDGVTAFGLGVACEVFGVSWPAMFGIPWYRPSVCAVAPGPVTTDAGSSCWFRMEPGESPAPTP
ncbi:MAG: hypothetical protein ACRDNZ_08265 [Streptosporangiaceae bacterium]